jgi:hypothetical protein
MQQTPLPNMPDVPPLEEKINSHVKRLHRYLPFSPLMDQVFEEHTSSTDSLNLDTKAHDYLISAVKSGARLVVLTGDAGHGKTHLCRRLIQHHLGYNEEEARKIINTNCDGTGNIPPKGNDCAAVPLRIYKDFSELDIALGAKEIEKTGSEKNEVAIICANEGRLREVLESTNAGAICAKLTNDFSESFNDGLASREGKDHIINLNYQSVASDNGPSLISRTLHEWLKGNRWNICQKCTYHASCPIYRNRNLLSPKDDEKGELRRAKVESLFATAERLGSVVTIREMLMATAYIVTGGLTCEEVHRQARVQTKGWQPKFAFYNLLFRAPSLPIKEKLHRIPILQEISRLDPGLRALRVVDERIINEQEQFAAGEIDIIFHLKNGKKQQVIDASNGIDDIIGNPRSRTDRQKEASLIKQVVRSLRRRAFFDDELNAQELMIRLGFENGGEFLEIISGQIKPARMSLLKNRVMAGLHMLQGLRMGTKETNLHLVDPAFGSATSHAAIIARRISAPSVKLLPMGDKWNNEDADDSYPMTSAVDWLDRHIILRIKQSDEKHSDFPLNLMMFDCTTRAAGGYVAEDFYAHDVRRITNFLGRIAERSNKGDDEISLFLHGRMHSVAIDDGVIQVGGGN